MKVYLYKGVEYKTEREVRKAIFEHERKAFHKVTTAADWAKHGVAIESSNVKSVDKEHEKYRLALVKNIERYRAEYENKLKMGVFSSSLGILVKLSSREIIRIAKDYAEKNHTTGLVLDAFDVWHELDAEKLSILVQEIDSYMYEVFSSFHDKFVAEKANFSNKKGV